MLKITACIPARYESTRLPGKPLQIIGDKPLILHVAERVKQARYIHDVVVLTDDERIVQTMSEFGYRAVMTSSDCQSGTDRIIEFSEQDDAEVFINIQGDEVLISPSHIDYLCQSFVDSQSTAMATLGYWRDDAEISKPNVVKIVTDNNDNALYFSRNVIPVKPDGRAPERALCHIGMYIYHRQTLQQLKTLPVSSLEAIERLEQLRALQAGINVKVFSVDAHQGLGVDTPEDLAKARELFSA